MASTLAKALQELHQPTSTTNTINALKQLKNDLVGHSLIKENAIRQGIIPALHKLLHVSVQQRSAKSREINGHGKRPSRAWAETDELRLQAILVVGSLALGGPAFISPILAGKLQQALVFCASPAREPSRIAIASLQALNNLVESAKLSVTAQDVFSDEGRSANRGQNERTLISDFGRTLVRIFSQSRRTSSEAAQTRLALRLIGETKWSENQKRTLVKKGVLDLLAARLASFIYASGYVVPGCDAPTIASLPPPLPKSDLRLLLQAIRTLILASQYRTVKFLYSDFILAVLPAYRPQVAENENPWGLNSRSAIVHPGPLDHLLPQLQKPATKYDPVFSKAFPKLGSAAISTEPSRRPSPDRNANMVEDLESPLFAWLLHIARVERGVDRLVAICLLSAVNMVLTLNAHSSRAMAAKAQREKSLAALVIPLLLNLLDETANADSSRNPSAPHTVGELAAQDVAFVQENAPQELAWLILSSATLQDAAMNAQAEKKLAQMLKRSFDPIPAKKPVWSSKGTAMEMEGVESTFDPTLTSIGDAGFSPEFLHVMLCRAGSLRGLAAVAEKDDTHRKRIIDAGVLPCLMDSLVPMTPRQDSLVPKETTNKDADSKKSENPTWVVISACALARALTRSVGILRTTLLDSGLWKPIHALVEYSPESDMQIAATDVLCNLALELSGVREDLMGVGIIKTLSEHCHSSNSQMRTMSLWALKHLVAGASAADKLATMRELGIDWVVSLVSADIYDIKSRSPPAPFGTPNAAGQQVDILNSETANSMIDEDKEDDDNDSTSDGDEQVETERNGAITRQSNLRSTINPHRALLRRYKEDEENPAIAARKDQCVIQEQALGFILNLIQGQSASEMLESILGTIGFQQFFDILHSKLRAFPQGSSPDLTTAGGPLQLRNADANTNLPTFPKSYHAPYSVVLPAITNLVHIAASHARHKALLLQQKALMQSLLPMFVHESRKIRVETVWIINNLTWLDDESDRAAARQRAQELKAYGIEERLRVLMHDTDMDVRERTKTAIRQITELLNTRSTAFER